MNNKQQSNKRKSREQNKKQISQVYTDPTNIFLIENPEVLPPLTQTNQTILKDLLHSTNVTGFKFKSNEWINKITHDLNLNQMLIRINQINTGNQKLPKFLVQLHPSYKKFSFNHFVSNNSVQTSATIYNITNQSLNNFTAFLKWNFRKKCISTWGQFKFWGPWIIQAGQKWGSPITSNLVTDSRIFSIKYILNEDSRRRGRIDDSQQRQDILFCNLKGHQTRLKRTQSQVPGNYLNEQEFKKIDVVQTGYQHGKVLDKGMRSYRCKIALGSDYYHTWYLKLKAQAFKVFVLNNYLTMASHGQMGLIDGKNVIPHEMFSRNQTKWMKERSRIYGHCRFDLIANGIQFLQLLNIYPSNYASLWVSKNYDHKIKLEAELGFSFRVARTMFRLDFSLLRLSGVKGEPRFGLKYQF